MHFCIVAAYVDLDCGLANKLKSERQCNYSRFELYRPSLGKGTMLTQYPPIAWGEYLGVRRCHASGIFDINVKSKYNRYETEVRLKRSRSETRVKSAFDRCEIDVESK